MTQYNHTGKLKTLPLRERPMYRVANGVEGCALRELIAAVVGGPQQLEIAETLLARYETLRRMTNASTQELAQVDGMGPSKAAALKAAQELGRRSMLAAPEDKTQVRSPADIAMLAMAEIGHKEQEHFWVLFLDIRNCVLGSETVYKGNLNETHVRITEVFREAVRRNCARVAFAHNHPSSNVFPSPEDVAITQQLVDAGELLNIEVLDHIIVSGSRWLSLKERGLGGLR